MRWTTSGRLDIPNMTTPARSTAGTAAPRTAAKLDFEHARFNMVEQQIRTWDVLDQDVLDLLFTVRREDYVPTALPELAFADLEIPLGDGERMWTPKMEARVLQELELRPDESRARNRHRQRLSDRAAGGARGRRHQRRNRCPGSRRKHNRSSGAAACGNASIETGDGARGYGAANYDAIVLTGSTPILPETWLRQLKPGGRLFAVVGDAPVMTARLMRWTAPGASSPRTCSKP